MAYTPGPVSKRWILLSVPAVALVALGVLGLERLLTSPPAPPPAPARPPVAAARHPSQAPAAPARPPAPDLPGFAGQKARALERIGSLGEDAGAQIAVAEALVKEAPDADARREAWDILTSIEERADRETGRRFRAVQERVHALLKEGRADDAHAAAAAFKPVCDRRGAWRKRVETELEPILARAEWPALRRDVGEALARGEVGKARALAAGVRVQDVPEAEAVLEAWSRQFEASRRDATDRDAAEARRRRFEAKRPEAEKRLREAREAVAREAVRRGSATPASKRPSGS
jgi:hypothetical protein